MLREYLEWTEQWDRSHYFWPLLIFYVLFMFSLYLIFPYIRLYFVALLTSVAAVIGLLIRNYLRKKYQTT